VKAKGNHDTVTIDVAYHWDWDNEKYSPLLRACTKSGMAFYTTSLISYHLQKWYSYWRVCWIGCAAIGRRNSPTKSVSCAPSNQTTTTERQPRVARTHQTESAPRWTVWVDGRHRPSSPARVWRWRSVRRSSGSSRASSRQIQTSQRSTPRRSASAISSPHGGAMATWPQTAPERSDTWLPWRRNRKQTRPEVYPRATTEWRHRELLPAMSAGARAVQLICTGFRFAKSTRTRGRLSTSICNGGRRMGTVGWAGAGARRHGATVIRKIRTPCTLFFSDNIHTVCVRYFAVRWPHYMTKINCVCHLCHVCKRTNVGLLSG